MRCPIFLIVLFPFTVAGQLKPQLQPANSIPLDHDRFIGQTEITNRMYREFVDYVKDSLITRILYDSLPDAQAVKILAVSQRELKNVSPENRIENEKKYSLDYTAYKTKFLGEDSLSIAILQRNLFIPQAVRFYKRREIDSRKLIYKQSEIESAAVYPDTLCWQRDYYVKYKQLLDTTQIIAYPTSELAHAYFWHPAYDNYPVVGLNIQQIRAYCHWYEYQLNKFAKDTALHYSVKLPAMEDYVDAMKLCAPAVINQKIGPENLINPLVYDRSYNNAYLHIHPAYQNMRPWSSLKKPEMYVMQQWIKTNATSPILNLLGGLAEICAETMENTDTIEVLGGDYYFGITDPNGIQENTLFYKRRFDAKQGYSYIGFRILITTR